MHVGYNLTWDGFSEHLKNVFNDLNTSKTFTDVTLVCDDDEIFKAHRFILSSCSDVFKAMFAGNDSFQPCVFLRGIQKREMELILKYMYFGEATFEHELLEKFLNVAKDLKVKDISQDAGNTAFNNALKKEERESQQNTSLDNEGKSVNALNEFIPQEEITSFATEDFSTRIDDLPMRDNKPRMQNASLDNEGKSVNESMPQEKDTLLATKEFSTRTDDLPSINDDLYKYKNDLSKLLYFQKKNLRKRKVWCPACNKFISGSKTHMTTHYQTIHEGIRWPCSQCEYSARDKYTLNKHVRAEHESSVVFKCDDCEYETKYKNLLKSHTKSHPPKLVSSFKQM